MRVELQQPLALLDIALAAGQVLGVASIYQKHFQTIRLEHVIKRNPVDSRGLHSHGPDSVLLEPAGEPMQVCGEAAKSLHRFWDWGGYRDVVFTSADINARGV